MSERLGWQLVPSVSERLHKYVNTPLKPGAKVLLALGDSFTEYQDTIGRNYIRYAEAEINTASKNIQSFNLAEAGTDFDRYLRNFCAAASQRKPDIAVFGIYIGNDISNFRNLVVSRDCSIPTPRNEFTLSSWLKQSLLINAVFRLGKIYFPWLRSGFYENTKGYVTKGMSKTEVTKAEERIPAELLELAKADAINPWDVAIALYDPGVYRKLASPAGLPIAEDYDTLARAIIDLNNRCLEMDIKCLFVAIPVAPWVSREAQSYFIKLQYDVAGLEKAYPSGLKSFLQKLTSSGVTTLDLLPPLREAAANKNLFISNDTHLNIMGQKIAGIALAEKLIALNWLKD